MSYHIHDEPLPPPPHAHWGEAFKKWIAGQFAKLSAELQNLAPTIEVKIDNLDASVIAQQETLEAHIKEVQETHPYAKEATLGNKNDDKNTDTIFGRLAKIFDKLSNLDFSSLAPKTAVQNESTGKTAIGMLEDRTFGLEAIGTSIINKYEEMKKKSKSADYVLDAGDFIYLGFLDTEHADKTSATPVESQSVWKIQRIESAKDSDGNDITIIKYPNGSDAYSFAMSSCQTYTYNYAI